KDAESHCRHLLFLSRSALPNAALGRKCIAFTAPERAPGSPRSYTRRAQAPPAAFFKTAARSPARTPRSRPEVLAASPPAEAPHRQAAPPGREPEVVPPAELRPGRRLDRHPEDQPTGEAEARGRQEHRLDARGVGEDPPGDRPCKLGEADEAVVGGDVS